VRFLWVALIVILGIEVLGPLVGTIWSWVGGLIDRDAKRGA
jgi:hypothetical protein